MRFKITELLLAFIFANSSITNDITTASHYESVYSITLIDGQHETIYNILKDSFTDLPTNKNKEVNFTINNNNYSLKIILKKSKLKMKYRSANGYNDKVKTVISKIDGIKSSKP